MRGLVLLLVSGAMFGQQLLYNAKLDKQGQQAAAAAKAIGSQPITASELDNLKIIEKQEIDGALASGYYTMRTQIQDFGSWEAVSRDVCKTLRGLYADDPVKVALLNADVSDHAKFDKTCTAAALKTEKDAYEKRFTEQQAAISANLKSSALDVKQAATQLQATASKRSQIGGGAPGQSADNTVKAAIDRVSDVKSLLDFGSSIDSKVSVVGQVKSIQKLQDGLKQLSTLIEIVDGIWASYAGVAIDPRSLAPSREKLAADLLAIDADRLKEQAAISARDALYLDDLRTRLEDCQNKLDNVLHLWYARGTVEESLTAGSPTYVSDRNKRVTLLMALHLATAGAVANQLPSDIETRQNTIAERRASLRRDAIYNGAYEQALQTAGERLSSYYASGLKPSDIASLLYYLSGIVSLPKLAY